MGRNIFAPMIIIIRRYRSLTFLRNVARLIYSADNVQQIQIIEECQMWANYCPIGTIKKKKKHRIHEFSIGNQGTE